MVVFMDTAHELFALEKPFCTKNCPQSYRVKFSTKYGLLGQYHSRLHQYHTSGPLPYKYNDRWGD